MPRLILEVGDRTVYVTEAGELLKGTVTDVTKWTHKTGFSYGVKYDDAGGFHAIAPFDWNDKYLFKEGDTIPHHILNEHLEEDDETARSD